MISQADAIARLTDSEPPIAAAVDPVPRICAWCPDFDRTAAENQHATHTMCPACAQRMLAMARRS